MPRHPIVDLLYKQSYTYQSCDIGGITWERPVRPRDTAWVEFEYSRAFVAFSTLRKLPPTESGHFGFRVEDSDRGITLRPGFAAQIAVNRAEVRQLSESDLEYILNTNIKTNITWLRVIYLHWGQ